MVKKKKRTVATSSKDKSQKATTKKSEKYASKKKKSYQAATKDKLGVKVAKKKSRSFPGQEWKISDDEKKIDSSTRLKQKLNKSETS